MPITAGLGNQARPTLTLSGMGAPEWCWPASQRDDAVGQLVDLDCAVLGYVGEMLARAADWPEDVDIDPPRGFTQAEVLLKR